MYLEISNEATSVMHFENALVSVLEAQLAVRDPIRRGGTLLRVSGPQARRGMAGCTSIFTRSGAASPASTQLSSAPGQRQVARRSAPMAAAPGYAPADVLAVAGMLGMGTIKTLLSKLMYGIQTRGIDGSVHSFEARAHERLRVSLSSACARASAPHATRAGRPLVCTARPTGARVSALPHRRSAPARAARAHERSASVRNTGTSTRRIARFSGAALRCSCCGAAPRRFGLRRSPQRVAMTFWPSHCSSEPCAAALFRLFALCRSLGTWV